MSLFDPIDQALGANETHAGLVSGTMEALGGGQGNLPVSAEQMSSARIGSWWAQPLT